MTLRLDPACRARLHELLVEKLPEIQAEFGNIVGLWSMDDFEQLDNALPRGISDLARDYIGELPLSFFTWCKIQRVLFEKPSDQRKPQESLGKIEPFTDMPTVVDQILSEFEDLPNNYTASWKLPEPIATVFQKSHREFDMGDRFRIESPNLGFENQYPMTTENEKIDHFLFGGISRGVPDQTWDQKGSYLFIDFEGYAGPVIRTAPIIEAISAVKALIGVGIAIEVFRYDRFVRFFDREPEPNSLVVHQKTGTSNELSWVYSLTNEIDELAAGLSAAMDHELDSRLRYLAAPFLGYARSKQIRLACEWLADSYVGTSHLLSFIQATTVLEILLGDDVPPDRIGLTELLANRCSYLIANSLDERSKIRARFNQLYDVRSKILHRGRNQLTRDEVSQFSSLLGLARRVISAEIKLLCADIATDKG